MSCQVFCKSLDGDMYKAGRDWEEDGVKCSPLQFMGKEAKENGVWPEDAELDRLTDTLIAKHQITALEPRRRRLAREHAAHKWIVDTYFKEYGVEPDGELSPTVEKAFGVVPANLTLFPFFWDNIIVEGILQVPMLDALIAETVSINSGTAVHLTLNETQADRTMGETGEFATFQEVNVSSTESTVKLKKFGAQITVSDEVRRRQRLPVFERFYARFGRQIALDITDLTLETLINGDTQWGGASGAATTTATVASGSPTYGDYVSLWMSFTAGYQPTDLILGKNGITKMLNIATFQDPLSGFKFQGEGNAADAVRPERPPLGPDPLDGVVGGDPRRLDQSGDAAAGPGRRSLPGGRAGDGDRPRPAHAEHGRSDELVRDPGDPRPECRAGNDGCRLTREVD
jgi:hypothetical protein